MHMPKIELQDGKWKTGVRGSIECHETLETHAQIMEAALQNHFCRVYSPEYRKSLRNFNSSEVATLLGMTSGHLRRLHNEEVLPDPEHKVAGRRYYSLSEVNDIRKILADKAKGGQSYINGRRDLKNDELQVLSMCNLKGGSGKTNSSIHISQYLALMGYKVLCLDLDPQASLTSYFGLQKEMSFNSSGSLYDAIRYDNPVSIRDVIRKSYFTGIDICPASLMLAEFEQETPRILADKVEGVVPFYERISYVLEEVKDDYDIVIADCAPSLGYITLSAINASTSIIVPVAASMVDFASMAQFLRFGADIYSVLRKYSGTDTILNDFKYLPTRFEPSDGPSCQMLGFLKSHLGESVMDNYMLKSTAIGDAAMTNQTVFEIKRQEMHRQTYDRALDSLMAVGNEVHQMLQKNWGR